MASETGKRVLSLFKIPSVSELQDESSELPAGEIKSSRQRDEQREEELHGCRADRLEVGSLSVLQ